LFGREHFYNRYAIIHIKCVGIAIFGEQVRD